MYFAAASSHDSTLHRASWLKAGICSTPCSISQPCKLLQMDGLHLLWHAEPSICALQHTPSESSCRHAGRLASTLLHAARTVAGKASSVPEAVGPGELLLLLVYRKASPAMGLQVAVRPHVPYFPLTLQACPSSMLCLPQHQAVSGVLTAAEPAPTAAVLARIASALHVYIP